MKKLLIVVGFAIGATALLLVACASSPKAPDDLDITLREVSNYLNESIPRGRAGSQRKIAFINIQSESAALTEYIIDGLIVNAVNDRIFAVVDRQQLDTVRAELNFNMSGEVSDQSAQAVGKMLGAQTIITGRVSQIGDIYRLNIRALETETVQVQGSNNWTLSAGKTLLALLKSKGSGYGSASYSANTASASRSARQSAQQTAPENGVYTFYPRLTATKAGLRVNNVFVPQVTVAGGYITIHFARSATGAWDDSDNWDYGPSGFYDQRNFILQDLENPSRSYNPVSAQETRNGMGKIWSVSFREIKSKRFKLTFYLYPGEDPPYIFDEIILGEPDR